MDSTSRNFGQLSRSDVRLISGYGKVRSYPKHTIVIYEGDESDGLYVILQGKVKVFVSDESGKEVILNIEGPLDYFGELALIDRAPRSASVMTLERSRLSHVSRPDFERCISENPALAVKLISALTQRVRALTHIVKELALLDVHERVVNTLLKLARKKGGKLVVEPRLTHQEIADMVGASREMVTRTMKNLAGEGLVVVTDRTITLGALPARE